MFDPHDIPQSARDDLALIGAVDYDALLAAAAADPSTDPLAYGAEHIDEMRACEGIIRFAQARAAELAARLHADRTALKDAKPVYVASDSQVAQSVCAEVALARQMSMTGAQAQFALGGGMRLLPHVHELFSRGLISERHAKAVVNEATGLSADDLAHLDREVADKAAGLTARQTSALARSVVLTLDSHVAAETARRARDDRFVTFTPHEHAMATLSFRMGADQAVAAHKALELHARGLQAGGDERTIGQLMVDSAFTWLTGHRSVGDVPVELNLVMTPAALFGADDAPARLADYGPIPAALAREMSAESAAWVRRLFTDEIDHRVVARDPRRRLFDGALGDLVRARDQRCSRPYCDCRIRDNDHIEAYDGMNTVLSNGQGLCRRSHTTKHLPGFQVTAQPDGSVEWMTPTGHSYVARKPPVLGQLATKPPPRVTRRGWLTLEISLRKLSLASQLACIHPPMRQ